MRRPDDAPSAGGHFHHRVESLAGVLWQRIIVVKSASAWRAAFESVARHVIFVDTPGVCASNLEHFDYRRRPVPAYPLERSAPGGVEVFVSSLPLRY